MRITEPKTEQAEVSKWKNFPKFMTKAAPIKLHPKDFMPDPKLSAPKMVEARFRDDYMPP